ncbi:MAG: hypothetical protein U9R29_03845 [Thermodesulfobacteriota bacterium]|nr:hypothetical protein [Thermodesulfobacteriota bacterium]
MIGIFWVYNDTVFGRAIPVVDGEERSEGLIDSPDNHNDFWASDAEYLRLFPELRLYEYLDIPRGRVLYATGEKQSIVYMDKTLFTTTAKQLVSIFFKLASCKVSWRTDLHYTTDSSEIDLLFERH